MATTPKPERIKNKQIRHNVEKFNKRTGTQMSKQGVKKYAKSLAKGRKSFMEKFEHRHSKEDLQKAHKHMSEHMR